MNIGIVGAGAIGRYIGAQLGPPHEVVFRVRRPDELGVRIDARELGGSNTRTLTWPAGQPPVGSVAGCDAVLVCVKSGATAEIARELAGELRADAIVVSLQNGVRNAERLRAELPRHRVLAGIVGFNVVRDDPVVQRTTTGPLAIERDPAAEPLVRTLRDSGLLVDTPRDIVRHQYTKLLVNLGNAVSALSGAPTRDMMLSRGYRRILASLIAEALTVLRGAKIKPARLRGIPVGIVPMMMRLPTSIVRIVARGQLEGIDPEARSSMWDDLQRGRATEIDELNGEIVRIADRVRVPAPRNRRVVELVRDAERAAAGSPKLTAEALAAELG
jgi:2-dehydropantoate 2-reductase